MIFVKGESVVMSKFWWTIPLVFAISTTTYAGNINVDGDVGTACNADRWGSCVQEGDRHYHDNGVHIDGNVGTLCNADNQSTCIQDYGYRRCVVRYSGGYTCWK